MKLAISGFEPRYRRGVDAPATSPVPASDPRRPRRIALITNRVDTRLFHAWRP